MQKIDVNVSIVRDHFRDGGVVFSDGVVSGVDISAIMFSRFGFDDCDAYDDFFNFYFNGKKCSFNFILDLM